MTQVRCDCSIQKIEWFLRLRAREDNNSHRDGVKVQKEMCSLGGVLQIVNTPRTLTILAASASLPWVAAPMTHVANNNSLGCVLDVDFGQEASPNMDVIDFHKDLFPPSQNQSWVCWCSKECCVLSWILLHTPSASISRVAWAPQTLAVVPPPF